VQWEKLHAFAKERQLESTGLSAMNKCLEEVEAEMSSCDEGTKKFSNLRDVEHSLISTKVITFISSLLYSALGKVKMDSYLHFYITLFQICSNICETIGTTILNFTTSDRVGSQGQDKIGQILSNL
jgi:hypothetical protein